MTELYEDYSFPLGDTDDEEFADIGKDCVGDHIHRLYCKYDNLNFKTFDHPEHKIYEVGN